jgi:hypothetical protein
MLPQLLKLLIQLLQLLTKNAQLLKMLNQILLTVPIPSLSQWLPVQLDGQLFADGSDQRKYSKRDLQRSFL